MELNEAVGRILRQHWLMILALVAVGAGIPALLHSGDAKTYTASTRLVLDTPDPTSGPESAAIADAARGIATSPAQVREALAKARVTRRNATDLARHDVSVRALGTSAVLQLSVSDRNPRIAAAVANALAARLIQTRLNAANGDVQQVLTRIDRRITKLNQRISQVDSEIASLDARDAASGFLRAKRNAEARLRASLARQRAVLESDQISLLSTDSGRHKPSIISPASVPSDPNSSRALADMILGALLGLILGIGLAGILETLRPTLIGRDAVARELDTPLLGSLSGDPNPDRSLREAAAIAGRLRLAAEASGVQQVGLLDVGGEVDLSELAEWLDAIAVEPELEHEPEFVGALFRGAPGATAKNDEAGDHARVGLQIRPFSPESATLNHGVVRALVVVAPATLKKAELVDVSHLLRVTRLPMLGLITYKRSRRPGQTGTDSAAYPRVEIGS
jgi:capsular polysaccharide biosynthesis protein